MSDAIENLDNITKAQVDAFSRMKMALNGYFIKYDHELSLDAYLEYVGGFDFF